MAAPSAVSALIPAVSSRPPDLEAILDINRAAYDLLAGTYKGTTDIRQENAKKWLSKRVPEITGPEQPTALDVGCADGTHSRVLSMLGYSVTGVDFSAPMISAARELMSDPTLPNKPSLLHGEFLAGRYTDEGGAAASLEGRRFHLVLATAFVHLFPPEADDDAVRKVLGHVAPGGTALISTTAATANRQGLELKTGANGQVAPRWRNHYTLEHFVWLVREAARDVYGARVPVQPWVVVDPDVEGKLWVDVVVNRPA
ncbi:class I SAM-dependent methyltransferase [Promicromonospora sp. MEB111]|uniref:class I SAM-dependent methyltransferase n=1 Tax=Promicromonospora sp. MEB111 TaxID=3040301 RepID=UPI00254F74FE|nr:class I SAM-dependent methyltransferase [Promicromonospora sp. MEB111]